MKVGDRVVALVESRWFAEGEKGSVKQIETFSENNLIQVLWDRGGLWWAVENELEVIE